MGAEHTQNGGLTPEERAFIDLYRQSPPDKQRAALGIIRAIMTEAEQQRETEKTVLICELYAEAGAMREITRLITTEYQTTNLNGEQQQGLYSALYGLEMIITAHDEHARQLAYIP